MVAAGSIRAGSAYVEAFLDTTRFAAAIRSLQSQLGRLSQSLSIGGASLAATGAAITLPLNAAVQAAGDAAEAMNLFRQVMGQAADSASNFANTLASATNRSTQDLRNSLATFQSFFLGANFDPSQALQLSQALTTLAVDFSSFRNVSQQDTLERFISAMAGSAEVLDQFGINLRESAIQAELLRQGITGGGTEGEKALARVAIIARELGRQGALGDASRTAGSFNNTAQGLSASLRGLQVSIGNALLPLRTEWNVRFAAAVRAATAFVDAAPELVVAVSTVGTAFIATGVGAVALGSGVLIASVSLGALRGVVATALSPVVALGGAFVGLGRTAAVSAGVVVSSTVGAATSVISSTLAASRAIVVGSATATLGALRAVVAGTLSAIAAVSGTVAAGVVPVVAKAAVSALSLVGTAIAAIAAGLGSALFSLASYLGSLGAVGTVLGSVTGIVALFATAIGTWPAVLLGALGALGVVAEGVDNLGAVTAALQSGFSDLAGIAIQSFRAIAGELLSGNLGKALEIAGVGLRAAWNRMLLALLQATVGLFGVQNTNTIVTAINTIGVALRGLVQVVRVVLVPIRLILRGIAAVVNVVVAAIGKLAGTAGDVAGTLDSLAAKTAAARSDLDALTATSPAPQVPEVPLPQLPSIDAVTVGLQEGLDGLALPDLAGSPQLDALREQLGFAGGEVGTAITDALEAARANPALDGLITRVGEAGTSLQQAFTVPQGFGAAVGDLTGGLAKAFTAPLDELNATTTGALPDVQSLLAGLTAPGGIGGGRRGRGIGGQEGFVTFSAAGAGVSAAGGRSELRRLGAGVERQTRIQERQLQIQQRQVKAIEGLGVA